MCIVTFPVQITQTLPHRLDRVGGRVIQISAGRLFFDSPLQNQSDPVEIEAFIGNAVQFCVSKI